eukprot:scaffold47905_cov20-Tisochrysis_lutea.AAC.1
MQRDRPTPISTPFAHLKAQLALAAAFNVPNSWRQLVCAHCINLGRSLCWWLRGGLRVFGGERVLVGAASSIKSRVL